MPQGGDVTVLLNEQGNCQLFKNIVRRHDRDLCFN